MEVMIGLVCFAAAFFVVRALIHDYREGKSPGHVAIVKAVAKEMQYEKNTVSKIGLAVFASLVGLFWIVLIVILNRI
jgi:hypothetical protein